MAVDESVLTYGDLMDYLVAMGEGGARSKTRDILREVVQGGYRDVALAADWNYYMGEHRINLSANYEVGTVEFDLTGHAEGERALTITTGTWPSWIKFGRIRIGEIVYVVSDTTTDADVILLDEHLSPTADVAAGTTYEAFRSVYPLPADMWRLDDVLVEDSYWISNYITPTEWVRRERFFQTSGQTWAWTLMKDPDADGQWALWVDPSPDSADPLGMVYKRRPRQLRWTGSESSARFTVTTATSGASTITTPSTLPATMVGSLVRFTTHASNYPTGLAGTEPYEEQHKIKSIVTTTVTLESTLGATFDGKKCTVSDPVDMPDTMLEGLKASLEYRLARMANDSRKMADAFSLRMQALRLALENDARYRMPAALQSRYHYLFRHLDGHITQSS